VGGVDVSVIISTRDRASILPVSLGSLANQDGAVPFEVIVVDNGSSDATPEVLAAWCRDHPIFRTTREDRPGLSRGKNAGIAIAEGSLLLFTDDDVLVTPSWVRTFARFFETHRGPMVVAGGAIVPIADDLGPWPPWLSQDALLDVGLLDHGAEQELHPPRYVFGANMAVPATVFASVGPWDEDLGNAPGDRSTFEDAELQDRVRSAGGTVWFCVDAAIRHRVERTRAAPRAILANAFARGRNDFWGERRGRSHGSEPAVGAVVGTAGLAANLMAEGIATAWFRATKRATSMDRARRLAWRAGRSFERLRPGRDRTTAYSRIGRVTFLARRILSRLAPRAP
jgi:glucosyl-dolichyl phosphate glucuronosyltransferase